MAIKRLIRQAGKTVFEVYEDASLPFEWTEKLMEEAKKLGIAFFTSPYSLELVDKVDPYACAYKIGSGDITWSEIPTKLQKNKPCILASGASNFDEVKNAMDILNTNNNEVCIMQCNTNYTAREDNFNYLNLNVLKNIVIPFLKIF